MLEELVYNVGKKNALKESDCMKNHRISRVKRNRKSGFRARMTTKNGRKTLSRKRRIGRPVNVSPHI